MRFREIMEAPLDYTIAKGDTLSNLAKKYNVGVNDIAKASGIADPNKLSIGQKITIPSKITAPVPLPRLNRANTTIAPTATAASGIGANAAATLKMDPKTTPTAAGSLGANANVNAALKTKTPSILYPNRPEISVDQYVRNVPTSKLDTAVGLQNWMDRQQAIKTDPAYLDRLAQADAETAAATATRSQQIGNMDINKTFDELPSVGMDLSKAVEKLKQTRIPQSNESSNNELKDITGTVVRNREGILPKTDTKWVKKVQDQTLADRLTQADLENSTPTPPADSSYINNPPVKTSVDTSAGLRQWLEKFGKEKDLFKQ